MTFRVLSIAACSRVVDEIFCVLFILEILDFIFVMEPVTDCNNANFDQACYQVDPAEVVREYMRDVRSTSDYSSLTRSVTEAEFGGYGVTVSASFSYTKNSEVTEESSISSTAAAVAAAEVLRSSSAPAAKPRHGPSRGLWP